MNWKRALVPGTASLLLGAILIVYARRPMSDLKVYVASGEAVLEGKDIYDAPLPLVNTCPPFFSVFCVAPALANRVSPIFAKALWTLLNLVSLLFILDMAARAIYGQSRRILSGPVLVPLLLTLPYILYHLQYQQVNLIVFAITLGGMKLQERHRNWQGGALVGLASALKVMPILFVGYLLYRRRWQAAFWAIFTTAAFTVSPCLLMGRDRYTANFSHWATMLPQNPSWDAGQRNQSLLALWDRIIGHGLVPLASPGATYLEMSGAPWVKAAWLATVLVLGLAMLVSFRGRPERDSLPALLEWSAVFVASSIVGPVGWKHYFVVLLLPNMVLYWIWRSQGDPGARRLASIILWGCFLLSAATVRDLFGSAWCLRLGMASNLTMSMLVMIGGLLWLRRRMAGAQLPNGSALLGDEGPRGWTEPPRPAAVAISCTSGTKKGESAPGRPPEQEDPKVVEGEQGPVGRSPHG